MNRKKSIITIAAILLFTSIGAVSADTRSENIELYLVFDKSKSMVEEIRDVTDYINETFIDDFLIAGDRLVLIQFYGKADLVYDGIISDGDKHLLSSDLSETAADGRFTDIGNALDRLNREVSKSTSDRRKYLILLTDGKQEAPPESPYYSPDGSFNHAFLENTKIIQKAGWKVIIIGIGEETAVEELADELGTTHEVINFDEGKPASKSSNEILGRITASDFYISNNILSFTLESEGYTDPRAIDIEEITYQIPDGNYPLTDETHRLNIEPGSKTEIEIILSDRLISNIVNNDARGTVIFKFSGDTPFLPAVFETVYKGADEDADSDENELNYKKTRDKENNGFNWLIIIVIIAAAAVIIAIIIVRNLWLHRDEKEKDGNKDNEISSDS